jgi:hypothetical protein
MRIASYIGNRPGLQGLFNRAVRTGLRIPYSHNELVFSDGISGSCSFIDHGVRLKRIDFSDGKWVFHDVDPARFSEQRAREWFECEASLPKPIRIKYSIPLLFTYPFPYLPINPSDREEVCCTAIARALGVEDHRKYDPHELPLFVSRPSRTYFHMGGKTAI